MLSATIKTGVPVLLIAGLACLPLNMAYLVKAQEAATPGTSVQAETRGGHERFSRRQPGTA